MNSPPTNSDALGAIVRSCVLAAAVIVLASASGAGQAPTRHEVKADDGHPLTVWEKRAAGARRTILLLHGRTWSSLPDFDLQVSGHPSSLMSLGDPPALPGRPPKLDSSGSRRPETKFPP